MALRSHRARPSSPAEKPGGPQLKLAQLIVTAEKILWHFARPLMALAAFFLLAWLGVFTALYPWAHLAALAVLIGFFFSALGKARMEWKPATPGEARRRVEEASGLPHRPLDVLEDRPVTAGGDAALLWQAHAERARAQVRKLRWPKWKLSFADRDPYALRYGILILLAVSLLFGWGALGGRLIAAINPALAKIEMLPPALDAWITPPDYTHLPPIMIATPAGDRHKGDVIDVPEGSVINAHLAEKDGDVPTLSIGDQTTEFGADDHQDFGVSRTIHEGDGITIRRGWEKLGSWKIHVVPDQPPQIAFSEPPSVTERKSIRLAYEASDDYGVTSVIARITPRESLPGASTAPIEMTLTTPDAKDVKRVSFEDLTAHPWAGLPVQIQLIATDADGHKSVSDAADFTLPERVFLNPVARSLVEERRKLLEHPDDDTVRVEAADIMAGIAHQPADYRGDPVVLMALRSGAMRLALNSGPDAVAPVDDLLWQTAVRIEDGAVGMAEQNLRDAQKALADALDRNAGEQEIQRLIDRLHQALAQYLSELSTRMAAKPAPADDLSQLLGTRVNMLTPHDLDRMLEHIRDLSATGARDAARQQLSQLQQMLENMQTAPRQLTAEQKQALQRIAALRALIRQQQQLLDRTFQETRDGRKTDVAKLANEQKDLLRRLQDLIGGMKGEEESGLPRGADAMKAADSALTQGSAAGAVPHQTDAVQAMQQAMKDMADQFRMSFMMLPRPGGEDYGANGDPFGRDGGGFMPDDGSVKVPDQMESRHVREILDELQRRAGDMARPRIERDYIERLLQNF